MKRFPDATIHYGEQRTDEWFAARAGRLTASAVGDWISEQPKCRLTVAESKELLTAAGIEIPKGAKVGDLHALLSDPPMTYTAARHSALDRAIAKCVADECQLPKPPDFVSWHMQRGIDHEAAAVEWFENLTGLTVEQCSFAAMMGFKAGCSPDGLIAGANAGFEGKVPDPEVHCLYLRRPDRLVEDHGLQCRFSMAVTGADEWHLQSFCPGMPSVNLALVRNEQVDQIRDGVVAFSEELAKEIARVADLWDEQMA